MTKPLIATREEIEDAVDIATLIDEIERGLIRFSRGDAVVPPVGLLQFDEPPGEAHIKYGYLKDEDSYLVKIASGFYRNPSFGLPSSQGVVLLFSQGTGELQAILLDRGYLTDLRTAIAGAICAKHLAPRPKKIGIVGTGTQARYQRELLKWVIQCPEILSWNRSQSKERLESLARECDLIITTTPSREPLLKADWIQPGTHITAVGADTPGKQELDPDILRKADLVLADSLDQCRHHGELACAPEVAARELGEWIGNDRPPDWITVADLSGIVVEDIGAAEHVLRRLQGGISRSAPARD